MAASSTKSGGLISDLVSSALTMNFDAEWSEALLFTPFLSDQALITEYADSLSAQTFLRMAGLPYHIRQRPNAEFISPTGKVPFLKLKNILVAEFTGIVNFVAKKGVKLSSHLNDVQTADMAAHVSVVDHLLRNIETYILWAHDETYSQITRVRYASVYHWPLTSILPALKRREILEQLNDMEWSNKELEEVIELAERAFRSLSAQLGNQPYLMGDKPTEADALLFGHLYTIMTTRLPCMDLQNTLKKYSNLIEYTVRIEKEFFKH